MNTKNEGIGSPENCREVSCFSGMLYVLNANGSYDIPDYYIETLHKMLLSFTLCYERVKEMDRNDLPFVFVMVTGVSKFGKKDDMSDDYFSKE